MDSTRAAIAMCMCTHTECSHAHNNTKFREENFRDQKSDHEIHENIVPRKFGAIRYLCHIMPYLVVFLEFFPPNSQRKYRDRTPTWHSTVVMVVARKCNDPAYNPPPYFCPILACTKGGGRNRGILRYINKRTILHTYKLFKICEGIGTKNEVNF